jgi:hypothetical protein
MPFAAKAAMDTSRAGVARGDPRNTHTSATALVGRRADGLLIDADADAGGGQPDGGDAAALSFGGSVGP